MKISITLLRIGHKPRGTRDTAVTLALLLIVTGASLLVKKDLQP